MRTTLDIPGDLLQDVQSFTRLKSKTDVVIYSLQEVLRLKKLRELSDQQGRLPIAIDLEKSRRRPRKH